MRTATKAVVTLAALVSIVLAGAAPVMAADPGTIGGKLSAGATSVTLTSQGTLPVAVVMTAEAVTLKAVSAFDLDPGKVHVTPPS